MLKKGRRVKNWKRRWFILKGPRLYYYKSQHRKEKDKAGTVNLESCVIDEIKQRKDSRKVITFFSFFIYYLIKITTLYTN